MKDSATTTTCDSMGFKSFRRGAIFRIRALMLVGTSLLVSGCMSDMISDINPNSEIANSVQQEYRRFVNYAEPELGAHETTQNGRVVPSTAARTRAGPLTPVMVEALARGGAPASAYWEQSMSRRQNKNARAVSLSVDDLVNRMISQSNQLAAASDVPLIRDTVANEATGRFDPFIFANSEYESIDQPRSSLLETGTSSSAPENLSEDRFGGEFGIGQPLITGGEIRLSQRLGTERSNSEFFVPDRQANSDLALEVRQPLLDGAGVLVNTAPIHLAKLERDRSIAELQRQIEDQFIEVMRSYWTLYGERGRLLQRQRLVGDLRGIAQQISARAEFDTLAGEREQAAAATRRAEASTIRARSGVDNAQARLSALLSDPTLYGDRVEIIPKQHPIRKFADVPLEDVALLALQNRPEVKSVALQLRAAELQQKVAKNKLLPDLDLEAGISNGGLAGDYDVDEAWSNQFDQSDVDGFVNVRFKMPLGNRSDRSFYDRRRFEVRQLTSQLRNVSDTVLLEAQVAVREARTAYEEMRAREAELAAINTEIAALRARADEGLESGSAFLATLISGFEDRADTEQRLLEAVVSYNLALYQVERVAGTLLSSRGVEALRIDSGDLDHIAIVRRALGKDNLPVGADSSENLLVNPRAIERGSRRRNGGSRGAQ